MVYSGRWAWNPLWPMMSTGESVIVEYRGAVASIRLDRADHRNALTYPMLELLLDACEEVADDSSARVVVLTGTGSAFCAGGDIHHLLADDAGGLTETERRQRLVRLHRISWLLHTMAKPTIAAINGPAMGPGLSLALACDFRVMASTATLGTAFARLGVPGDFGGAWFASHLLGVGRAKALYLLNPMLGPEDALAWGLVTSVAAPEQFGAAVDELASRLATGPAEAFALMKANFAAALTSPLAEFLETEAHNMILGMSTKEFEEGAQAFLEGRAPDFTAR
ncbi:MAG: 2-(1,2-epoxy,2-dihydrophenyl)acetyl-CoA isomerase [Actinomycetota bacterium]|jgi:2-(1,2-epoxy-1,2-dihydrophenyl)acetyl-CoA isomerase|nr:2-(1,2-epoxy,2-dihydrophenyl)acetyl-CoA isomerase [Actinomycetota bacterium]